MNTSTHLLTLKEFADAFHVSPHTVRKWKKEGRVKPVRVCGIRKLLFDPADVERLINESREEDRHDLRRSLRVV